MKFTLNDYQSDAVGALLAELKKAKDLWLSDHPKETSVALTAPTGAGKTVMAAATIEALFFGSDEFDFAPDDSAVVIWFSDNPNLNDQSRFRLMEASEKLSHANLVTIKPPFSMRKLEPGKAYFLNAQRLSKTSKLTRGFVPNVDDIEGLAQIAPDDLAHNLWETIGNTIADPDLTVYFVLDEAHRGFNDKADKARDTIVKQLVDGSNTGHVMPVIVGISATIERFKKAMKAASDLGNRTELEDVIVEPARVQESGLLKDIVLLDIPNEPGDFSETLVTEAAKALLDSANNWQKYSRAQKLAQPVVPLMVLQIPNTPDHDEVGRWLDAIARQIDTVTGASVRHVLGENKAETFGRWEVDWIEPQRVQQSAEVTILVAKEAISTGWDCPRAEVLVSARPAQDQTHIAQLLGRMVRSPLARRVPGNDRLNSVACILPRFDRTAAGKVVRYITGQSDELSPLGQTRVYVKPCDLISNPNIGPEVWAAYDALPTQTTPKRGVKAVKRLVELAQALSQDGLLPGALAEVSAAVHAELDKLAKEHAAEYKDAVTEIKTVRIQRLIGKKGDEAIRYRERAVAADDRAVQVGFDEAKRVFGSDVAQSYVIHLTRDDDDDDGLRDAYIRVSALATMPSVSKAVDVFADALAGQWFARFAAQINDLSDERLQVFDKIRELATEPQLSELRRPASRLEDYASVDKDGKTTDAKLVDKHLMSDEKGKYPIGALNLWEQETVEIESAATTCVGWYRNPSHRGSGAFAIPYRDGYGEWRSLHPDFVFFEKVAGDIKPSIVDPHATNLEDGTVKLVGLAEFAEAFGEKFHRIYATAKRGPNKWRALDMKDIAVRDAVKNYSGDLSALYDSDVAIDIYKS